MERYLFKCNDCKTTIKAYKENTSTRRKCASCGSYNVDQLGEIPSNGNNGNQSEEPKEIQKELVSVIIVNLNGKRYLQECLDSLKNQSYKTFEIILVDNNSTDDSVAFVRKGYPQVKIIENSQNNYCQANNLGIKASKGEFVALLNNDIKAEPDWMSELVKAMQKDSNIAGAGGKIYFYGTNKLQSTGHIEYPNFYWGDRGFEEIDTRKYEKTEEVESLCGAAVMYRKKYLEAVGLLDEDFIMYCEEVDVAIRLRKRGWKLIYTPKSIIYHKVHGTSYILNPEDPTKIEKAYVERNRLLLIAKHYPEKLAEAMSSSAFFYISKRYDILYDSIGLIILKLMANNPQKTVNQVIPLVFSELKKIISFEKNAANANSETKQEMFRLEKEFKHKTEALERELQQRKEEIKLKQEEFRLKQEELNKRAEEWHKAMDNKNKEIQKKTDEQTHAKIECAVHTENLNSANHKVIELRNQNQTAKTEIQIMQKDIIEKNQQISYLDKEKIELHAQIRQMNEDMQKLNQQLNAYKDLITKVDSEIAGLSNSITAKIALSKALPKESYIRTGMAVMAEKRKGGNKTAD